jgi:hypothetical protein
VNSRSIDAGAGENLSHLPPHGPEVTADIVHGLLATDFPLVMEPVLFKPCDAIAGLSKHVGQVAMKMFWSVEDFVD